MIAFSPFGSPDLPWGEKLPHILEENAIKEIAESLGVNFTNILRAAFVRKFFAQLFLTYILGLYFFW
jgi:hypothetical protein